MFNNIPPVTKNLILINIVIYVVVIFGLQTGVNYNDYLASYYFVSPNFEPYQLVTHMFAHSEENVRHILFNMLLLGLLGPLLENIWGARRFFIFYLLSGFGAYALYNGVGIYEMITIKNDLISQGLPIQNLTYELSNITREQLIMAQNTGFSDNQYIHLFFSDESVSEYWKFLHAQMLGASGAIFGLAGAHLILFPNTEIQLPILPIKVKYLIGGYVLLELYNGFYDTTSNIAHWAHIGGAVVGIIYVFVRRKFDKNNFY